MSKFLTRALYLLALALLPIARAEAPIDLAVSVHSVPFAAEVIAEAIEAGPAKGNAIENAKEFFIGGHEDKSITPVFKAAVKYGASAALAIFLGTTEADHGATSKFLFHLQRMENLIARLDLNAEELKQIESELNGVIRLKWAGKGLEEIQYHRGAASTKETKYLSALKRAANEHKVLREHKKVFAIKLQAAQKELLASEAYIKFASRLMQKPEYRELLASGKPLAKKDLLHLAKRLKLGNYLRNLAFIEGTHDAVMSLFKDRDPGLLPVISNIVSILEEREFSDETHPEISSNESPQTPESRGEH